MSDVDLIRRAAALMRERAEAATPGPWSQHTAEAAADTVIFAGREWVTNIENCPSIGEHMRTPGGSICTDQALPNGEHIASWHPAVALAVADLLERSARTKFVTFGGGLHVDQDALAVARAYLGEAS